MDAPASPADDSRSGGRGVSEPKPIINDETIAALAKAGEMIRRDVEAFYATFSATMEKIAFPLGDPTERADGS